MLPTSHFKYLWCYSPPACQFIVDHTNPRHMEYKLNHNPIRIKKPTAHHRYGFHFLFISLPPFLLGGAGIYFVNGWMLIPWILFVIAFFGFIEIRVMCSHCPHYAEEEKSLKCWANYGSPKLWDYRPGPMTLIETVVFFGGFVIVGGYPLLFLLMSSQ